MAPAWENGIGQGDEILVAGEARLRQEADRKHRPVLVVGKNGAPRWSPLWRNNPRILDPTILHRGMGHQILKNGPHCRPYVDYPRMRADFAAAFHSRAFSTKLRDRRLPWRFTDHKCTRGDLPFVKPTAPQGYVIIEPHTKSKASPNREWGWAKWQAVVDALPSVDWIQINPHGSRLLDGVRHLSADKFTDACRHMAGAKAYVGPEGGLYHAAAALHVPAVAIFGGFVSPANQGYDDERYINLYEPMGGASPCGQRVKCEHCTEALAKITPELVVHHVHDLMQHI